MFREIITDALAARNITKNKLGTMAEINRPCLFRFLAGEPTLGLASVEKIFRVLSLHVVDKRGKFVYYGYDLRNAVERSLQESGTLKKNMCAKIGMAQPNLTAFLNGRATSRPLMVERMLQVLDLFIKETEPPQTLSMLPCKHGNKRRTDLPKTTEYQRATFASSSTKAQPLAVKPWKRLSTRFICTSPTAHTTTARI